MAPVMAPPQLYLHAMLASNIAIAYMGKYYMAIYGLDLASFNSRAKRKASHMQRARSLSLDCHKPPMGYS